MRTAPLAGTFAASTLLVLVAGCAQADPDPGLPDEAAYATAEFDRRAPEVASAWFDSPARTQWEDELIPLEPLTVVPDLPADDPATQALAAGWLLTDVELPDRPPDRDEVTFPDGDSESVAVITAAEAWDAVHSGVPDCPDEPAAATATPSGPDSAVHDEALCTVLTVTDVYPGTVTIATNRGQVDTPAWWFEVEELAEPFARVAVAPDALTEPPQLAGTDHPYQPALVMAMNLLAVDGADLTYQVGVGACDTEPTPLVYETAEAVVVAGTATLEPGTTACTDQLVAAEVSVGLAEPLGRRPVLDTNGRVLTFGTW